MEPLRRRNALTTSRGRVTWLTVSLEDSRTIDDGRNHAVDLVTQCDGDPSLDHRITIFGVDGIQAALLAIRSAEARLEALRAEGHTIRWDCALDDELGLGMNGSPVAPSDEARRELFFEMHDSKLLRVSADGSELHLVFSPLSMRTADWKDCFPPATIVVRGVEDADEKVRALEAWGLPRRLSGDEVFDPVGVILDPSWSEDRPRIAISSIQLAPDGPEAVVLVRGEELVVSPVFDTSVLRPSAG